MYLHKIVRKDCVLLVMYISKSRQVLLDYKVIFTIRPWRFSFWLGLHFLCSAQFLLDLVHLNERNQLRPSTPCASVWIILQPSPFNCVASHLFAWPFHWLKCVFNVSLFRDTWLDNCTFFSVSWQTIYYENENAISSLLPINLPIQWEWKSLQPWLSESTVTQSSVKTQAGGDCWKHKRRLETLPGFIIARFANLGDLDETSRLGTSDWHQTYSKW